MTDLVFNSTQEALLGLQSLGINTDEVDIVTDATGTVVQSGGPFTDGNDGNLNTFTFNLADGCYTFTIYDAYSDGICCAYGNGSYTLDCTVINYASGGSFGASESTQFCVNQ